MTVEEVLRGKSENLVVRLGMVVTDFDNAFLTKEQVFTSLRELVEEHTAGVFDFGFGLGINVEPADEGEEGSLLSDMELDEEDDDGDV